MHGKRRKTIYVLSILYKDGIFSTVTDEELNSFMIRGQPLLMILIFDKLSDKYQELGYKVVWPMTEEGYGRWRWGIKTFLEQKDFNLSLIILGLYVQKRDF